MLEPRGVAGGCEPPNVGAETHRPDHLQELHTLLVTETSFHTHPTLFEWKLCMSAKRLHSTKSSESGRDQTGRHLSEIMSF